MRAVLSGFAWALIALLLLADCGDEADARRDGSSAGDEDDASGRPPVPNETAR